VTFNIIPYRGSAPGLTDLGGGQIDTYVDQLTTSLPHIRAGKFRALVVLGLERAAEIADVPTLQDAGSTGFDGATTAGLFVRAGTPAPVVSTLNAGVVAGLNDATVRQRLAELGATVRPTTSQAFADYLKGEAAAVQKLADMGLLKPEG
jgi:tripartite-type tricarboxylate transporter receptor subunit TctC